MADELLFNELRLDDFLSGRTKRIRTYIDKLGPDGLLSQDPETLTETLVERNRLDLPVLAIDAIEVDQEEATIDVSQDRGRDIRDRRHPFYINGTKVTARVPFSGEHSLFRCQPNTYTHNPPRGALQDAEILLHYFRTDHDAEKLKEQISQDVAEIQRWLVFAEPQVRQFNDQLPRDARGYIDQRRTKLLKDQELVSKLGFAVRKRTGAPQAFSVPAVQRRTFEALPPAAGAAPPDPTLAMDMYGEILTVLSQAGNGLEMIPRTLDGRDEEDLRNLILVSLNIQFEGKATGETFNMNGKTDILLRHEGKNVFVAEC